MRSVMTAFSQEFSLKPPIIKAQNLQNPVHF